MTKSIYKEKEYIIYEYTNKTTGKKYIGQTCNEQERIKNHKTSKRKTAFSDAIQKYGFDHFDYKILANNLNLNEANFLEEMIIFEKNTLVPNGYNLRTGGNNSKPSDISIEKQRKSLKEYYDNGGVHPMQGKKHTEESNEKNRQSKLKLYDNNPEIKQKFSDGQKRRYKNGHVNPMKGKKCTAEHIEKNRQAQLRNVEKGITPINKGVPMTDEQKEKLKLSKKEFFNNGGKPWNYGKKKIVIDGIVSWVDK